MVELFSYYPYFIIHQEDISNSSVEFAYLKGPFFVLILLEFMIKQYISFNSLISTYATRIRLLAKEQILFEFGLRRAQGPLAAIQASKNSYITSFDGISNWL